MYSEHVITKLNKIAYKYRDIILTDVVQVLSKYTNTGAGVESIKVDVVDGASDRSPELHIEFAEHINLLNLKKLQWTKMPPINPFEEWSKTKEFTGPVPGYKNGLAPNLPPWKRKLRIIWAIAMSKKKFDTWKPKPWRKKSLGTVLKEMNEEMLKEFDAAINEDLTEAIKRAGLNG